MRLWIIGRHFGWTPVPAMFEAAMQRMGVVGHCQLRDVEPAILPAVIDQLRNGVVDACVIARPYKASVAASCDDLSADAELLGGVNTVLVSAGHLHGDNTAALGFEMGLSTRKMWPQIASRAVILGAGPAAAAAALALSRVPAGDIAIAARSEAAAKDLVERFAGLAPVRTVAWTAPALKAALGDAQILVNCTPADPASLPLSIHRLPPRCTVVDMRFLPRPTALMKVAESAHRRGCDGFDVYLYTQMLAFGRGAAVEASWEVSREALEAAVADAPAEVNM